jgi:chromosome segregation ATPase
LKEVAVFEESSVQREKDPKKKLTTITKTSDAALKHNISKLTEQNHTVTERFQKMQQQMIDVLKEKTAFSEQLEQAKSEVLRLKAKLEEKGEKVEVNLEYTSKMADEKTAAQGKNAELQKEMEDLKKQLKEAQDQLTKKVNDTTPFQNMKKMIQKKNNSIKQLREALIK